MSTPEQVNFVYRYQAKKTSRYGILVTYLKDEDAELTIRERILNPLVAFWLPFAFQEYSNASPEEIQQLARSSIYQLIAIFIWIEQIISRFDSNLQVSKAISDN
jgi:hypothetical protein